MTGRDVVIVALGLLAAVLIATNIVFAVQLKSAQYLAEKYKVSNADFEAAEKVWEARDAALQKSLIDCGCM